MVVVLIPAYEPDEQLITLTRRLAEQDLSVLVVDDGSGEKYGSIFAQCHTATVITLPRNSGKGAALKAGMRYILENLPECTHVITCDADGQHRVEDVVRVRERLLKGEKFVLTVRQRTHRKIPLRSRVGNSLSRFVYALLANRYLSDNQSGLRGFAREHLSWLTKVERNNYDYEMNMLYYAAKKNIRIDTLPIEAIYIGNNESSHFNPVMDTVKIYRSLFRLAVGSILAFGVAELLMGVLSLTVGYHGLFLTMSIVAAVSYTVGTLLNMFVFFRHTPCHDYLRNLIYTVVEYFVYTLGCMLLGYAQPELPLFLAFNLVYILGIPLRYCLHKFTFVATRTRE